MAAVAVAGGHGLATSAQLSFLVPLRALDLGISLDAVGWLVGLQYLLGTPISLFAGRIIERFSARAVFVVGCAAVVVGASVLATTDSVALLFVIGPVLGAMQAMAQIASQTLASAHSRKSGNAKLVGAFALVANTTKTLSPVVIGLWSESHGFRPAFWLIAGYSLFYVLFSVLLGSAPKVKRAPDSFGRGLPTQVRTLFRVREMTLIMTVSGWRLWVGVIYDALLPAFLVTNHVSADFAGVIVGSGSLIAAVISPVTNALLRWMVPGHLGALSVLAGALGILLIPVFGPSVWLFITSALVGICMGITLPLLLAMIGQYAPSNLLGLATGVRVGVNRLAGAVAPTFVGGLSSAVGLGASLMIGGGLGLGGAVLVIALHFWAGRGQDRPGA